MRREGVGEGRGIGTFEAATPKIPAETRDGAGEYPDFCVLSHTLPKEREYGDQERDFGRVAEG